jgi:hypothetical protein
VQRLLGKNLLKGNGASTTRWLPYPTDKISPRRLVIRENVTARKLLELCLTEMVMEILL